MHLTCSFQENCVIWYKLRSNLSEKNKYMKKIIIVAISLFASASLFAGEVNQYSGPYVGIQMGYAKGDFKGTDSFQGVDYNSYSLSPSGYLWGALVGYNKIVAGSFLLGVEADYDQRNANGSGQMIDLADGVSSNGTFETKAQKASSLRLRVGKIFNQDQTLAYVTAGYAAVDIKSNFALAGLPPFSKSEWTGGYTAGFGLEHFVNDALSIKTEYRYSHYGKIEIDPSAVSVDLIGQLERTKYENENSIRLGLMYHF